MTNDTSYREKGRAAFLAAIMVLSMIAVPMAFAGTTAAQDTSVDKNNLGNEVFFGQEINITNLTATDDTVQLRRGDHDDSTLADRFNTGGGDSIVIDTSELEDANYFIRDDDGDSGIFEVLPQEIGFSFADDSVSQGDTTTLNFEDDNRAEEVDIHVDAAGALNAEDLEGIFAADNASEVTDEDTDDDYVLIENVTEGDELDADFSGIDPDDYTFTVEVTDTSATDEAEISVTEAEDEDAQFAEDTVTEEIGDVAEFEIETSGGADEVWLTITDDRDVFDVTVEITNFDQSEPIDLTWNTHHARNETANIGLSAENGDVNVTSAEGQGIGDGHLPNLEDGWTFDFEAFTSETAADEGDFTDIQLVDLQQRQTGELTTYTAPGVNALSHDDDIEDILEDATERNTVADQDLLIAEVEVSGVYGYLNTEPTQFANDGLEFDLTGEAGVFGDGAGSNISDLDGAATIVDQPEDNTIYFVIDSSQIPEISDGESWDAEFSIEGADNPYVEDSDDEGADQTASSAFTYEDRTIEIAGEYDDNDRLVLDADSESEITAETNVAPGTDANLRVNLPRAYRTASGAVSEDGEFTAAVDLSGLEEGTQLRTVRVRAPNSGTEASVEGVIGDGAAASFSASGDAPSEVDVDGDAQLDATVTNDGQADGTAEISITVDGEEVASESVDIAAGESWEDSYDIPTGEEGDVEWEVSTQHDSDSGTVTVGTTEDDTEGDDEMGDDDETTDDTGDDDGDDDGQPGFGVLVALFALIGAALLALRRQN